ncbi:DUF5666 domain-containing protein [Acidicapsa acidisoli]|uniref:DUF5666 domain-containing protein n=1 Tax=Acidicapsa acidisoli TaxID=1615681 RepID=UPI0021E0C376|nr:DUF5666 domain-containing protein [Acidicapsa acidisoli]
MQANIKRSNVSFALRSAALLLSISWLPAMALPLADGVTGGIAGQTPAPAANRFLGTITAVGSGMLTVKTDAGAEHKVTVPDGVRIQRIAPGAKDLSNAATIQFSDLAVGDRVLVRLSPDSTTDPVTAISIVAIPQADLAQKQQQDREDWQRNGVGGLVKSVDAGTGVVVIVSGAGATQKTITLHTTPTTVLRRYAENSVSFDQAKPAPIETIQAGDQLRARGAKNADGTELAAVEVVSGSFRNISGTISSINASAMTIALKDLLTKQNVTVHIGPEAQMRKLPDMMAKALAAMTKPGEGNGAGAGSGSGQGSGQNSAQGSSQGGQQPAGNVATGGQAGGARPAYGAQGGAGGESNQGRRGGGDLQQMLNRAPAIHLADLQKGDAVMLVSTQGSAEVTAVTLLAGVEPLLQAPASTQNMLLSNWNMSSGGAEAAQ